ncbi:MAG: DegT/DnrJ/EryC1/StrS family aminotransferase [Prolixibacteraceae bacterium]|nr:DegT/DnrJ/EryC1/StrS family aminotransferase [Prolixibacteraceae bacterium]
MTKKIYQRRQFLKNSALTGLGIGIAGSAAPEIITGFSKNIDTPAILGGQKVHTSGWPEWPVWKPATDEDRLLEVIRSGVWSRRHTVTEFEQKWAELIGAKRCLTTVNGTNALICAIKNLDIGAGDEVITTPFTFIATTISILQNGAIPVFADIDPSTLQIDPAKIEEKITPRTRAILPVHIYGIPADMNRIMAIAKKHNLLVVEDACQAWLAEINHKKVGTFGNAGCFSFQNSKHLPMGEGGAIVSDDEEYMDRCYSYHNYGGLKIAGTKMRLAEYQAAIGLAQLKRLDEQTTIRNQNADYLRSELKEIPGIIPHRLYDGVTRGAYHLFPFRYKKAEFKGLPRAEFMKALNAEGIPCGSGYGAGLNTAPYIKDAFDSKNYRKMYTAAELNFDRYVENNQCPLNDHACSEENVSFSQRILLGSRSDMDDIVLAIKKIHDSADKLVAKS